MTTIFQKLRQKFSVRTLRVDIMTLFLSLIIVAFACVILYSYWRSYLGIQEYSKKTMERVSATIIERMKNVGMEVESTLTDSSGLLLYSKGITANPDPDLIRFMIGVNDYNADISAFILALPSGDALQVNDVALSTQTHFITEPTKPLSPDIRFVIKERHVSTTPPSEKWTYVDKNYKTIAAEQLSDLTADMKSRPWYVGALNNPNIFWTPPYYLPDTYELSIAAGKSMYNREGRLLGVLGTNLSFISLSNFVSNRKISRSGYALIVDEQGKIVLPDLNHVQLPPETQAIATAAWQDFKKNNQTNFMFHYDSKKYLAYFAKMPTHFGGNWTILIVAPFQDFFGNLIRIQIEIILITLIILFLTAVVVTFFSKKISKPIVNLSKEIDKITNLDLSKNKRINSHIIEINMMESSIDTLRTTMRSFARYVPKEIVRQLLHRHKSITLTVEKRDLTILFSDIRDFTTIAEAADLNKLMAMLSAYFDGLSRIILQNKGTIDKYIGDSIMAFWGAPLEDPTHVRDACMTALLCCAYLKNFNKHNQENNSPAFYTRFGINTGEVLVGNIGTQQRMNYTVIGDPVNLAARLQSVGKIYHVEIVVGQAVYQKIKSEFLCRPLDKIAVKGKKQETDIYQLLGILASGTEISAQPAEIKLCQDFTQAYQTFMAGDLPAARLLFLAIQKEFPDDYPTQIFLERIPV